MFFGNMSPFEIALTVSLLNLFSVAVLVVKPGLARMAAVLVGVAVFAFVVIPRGGRVLETVSLKYQWRGFKLEDVSYSVYGSLAVTAGESGHTFYENGVPLFTSPDPEAAEQSVHLALLQHPSPQRVLLIGGGAGGALEEIIKHPGVEHTDYVELDPMVLRLADRYAAGNWSSVRNDPRVAVYHDTDGRRFLKRAQQTYDVIIVNMPDPQNAAINRFYTVEFFQEAAARLTTGGVLSLGVSGAENFISDDLAAFL
ncbi:MAG: methyltransferase, partial [Candidatus Krumholzibacteria bacterium]|nr:methyltransferase [Candidatus Krumholzibacteria bacterium]